MSNRKIYQVEELAFIYKKNAKKEGEFKIVEIEEYNFAIAVKDSQFLDVEDFLKNNPKFMQGVNEFEGIEDIKLEEEKKEVNLIVEFQKLQERLQVIEKENEKLKESKVNLSFEEVQQLVKEKTAIIRQLTLYQVKLDEFEKLLQIEDKTQLFDNPDITLTFRAYASSNNNEVVLKSSSKLVIFEFIHFIISKLQEKCNELRAEIEIINI